MGKFKVGEVAIGQHFVHFTHRNGAECVILEPEAIRTGYHHPTRQLRTGLKYVVQWADGKRVLVKEKNLRKKRPPQREIDTIVSWEKCDWRPVKEVA